MNFSIFRRFKVFWENYVVIFFDYVIWIILWVLVFCSMINVLYATVRGLRLIIDNLPIIRRIPFQKIRDAIDQNCPQKIVVETMMIEVFFKNIIALIIVIIIIVLLKG